MDLCLLALRAAFALIEVGALAPGAASASDRQTEARAPARASDSAAAMSHLLALEIRLLAPTTENDYAPVWSPDGSEVLFHSWRGGTRDLWIVSAAGGAPRRLATGDGNDQFGAWSPDGHWIAYTAHLPGPPNQEIFIVDRDGAGPPRALIAREGEDYRPAWSPDGRWLAFTSSRLGSPDVWVAEVSHPDPARRDIVHADSVRLLIGGPGEDGYASWSPSGDRIVFQSAREGGVVGVWIAAVQEGVLGPPVPVARSAERCAQPVWAPDGDAVAFVRWEGRRRRLMIAPLRGDAAGEPARVPLPDSLAPSNPSWSPDGRSIAFAAYAGGCSRLWVVTDPERFAAYRVSAPAPDSGAFTAPHPGAAPPPDPPIDQDREAPRKK